MGTWGGKEGWGARSGSLVGRVDTTGSYRTGAEEALRRGGGVDEGRGHWGKIATEDAKLGTHFSLEKWR